MQALPMFISHLLMNGIYGLVVGLCWSFALGNSLTSGILYGAIIGAAVGLFMFVINMGVSSRGNLTRKELTFASGSWSGILLVMGIAAALVTWIVRLIFF